MQTVEREIAMSSPHGMIRAGIQVESGEKIDPIAERSVEEAGIGIRVEMEIEIDTAVEIEIAIG
jgi:hypothetical protein